MGLISVLFNLVGSLVKSGFKIILFIVVLICVCRGCSKFGDAKKLDSFEGYYKYTVRQENSKETFEVSFLNSSECVIDGVEYNYHFTKYLCSYRAGVLGFEVALENKVTKEKKVFRIVQAKHFEKGGFYHAFLHGLPIPENTLAVTEEIVDCKTWNEGRENISDMEYVIMEEMVKNLMQAPTFFGVLL